MAIRIELEPADIVAARFAISPLWEAANAVRLLTQPTADGYHAAWRAAVASRLDGADLRPLVALNPPSGWVPDFLTPPPGRIAPTIGRQLAAVARTSLRQITAELERTRGDQGDPELQAEIDALLVDPAAGRARICDLLADAWRLLIEPWWPRLRDLLDADLAHRARTIAAHGFGAAIDDLHPRIRFAGDAIVIRQEARLDHPIAGAGLVLQPSAFSWPAVIAVLAADAPAMVVYPVRGIAHLWQAGPPQPPAALARLLGRSRAQLLADLAEARSTTSLAHRHGLGAAGVSAHLQALHGAGLVQRRRSGHEVRYVRTPLGDAVVAGREAA